jgi:hypothetical protein
MEGRFLANQLIYLVQADRLAYILIMIQMTFMYKTHIGRQTDTHAMHTLLMDDQSTMSSIVLDVQRTILLIVPAGTHTVQIMRQNEQHAKLSVALNVRSMMLSIIPEAMQAEHTVPVEYTHMTEGMHTADNKEQTYRHVIHTMMLGMCGNIGERLMGSLIVLFIMRDQFLHLVAMFRHLTDKEQMKGADIATVLKPLLAV